MWLNSNRLDPLEECPGSLRAPHKALATTPTSPPPPIGTLQGGERKTKPLPIPVERTNLQESGFCVGWMRELERPDGRILKSFFGGQGLTIVLDIERDHSNDRDHLA